MQEFQPIPGLTGRLFGGAADRPAGLLRRGGEAAAQEEVRCPRCDSANTKFCYYNNYNLSQPRHFCKGCRRYWTKGGLLRNVPVGGGCRKPKRKAAASSSDVDKDGAGASGDAKNAHSGCSAGSSSTTSAASSASTNTVDVGAGAAAYSNGRSTPATGLCPITFTADAPPLQPPAPMFADQAATFASLFGTPRPAFTFSAQRKAEDDVAPAVTLTEQPSSASSTADMAPFSARSTGAATASQSDWPPATIIDAGIFDLAGAVGSDTTSYWNTASWTDPDGNVYLP
ncbi:dof zinc finger protein 4-like [Hordeum vulgare subsp. vulgare]|uniref:Dof zinc finger protein n=1 Tax=Hordeum vulgare subsp. vulgare TaxID=112509 RepID=A5HWF3_HORVV|nr:dof zinc finger protein 4-like [Hordeum vulgare subsp. vulgare]KAI4975617.1 hypothetical protein ZWY2020_049224 [Hordeum vulgare]BAK06169.1 predicted protein [Hordeum vulgare subsp. vulgare]CAJ29310.1 dof zinc finger protein 4 [Hordeum vulgare subsp. vulgare]